MGMCLSVCMSVGLSLCVSVPVCLCIYLYVYKSHNNVTHTPHKNSPSSGWWIWCVCSIRMYCGSLYYIDLNIFHQVPKISKYICIYMKYTVVWYSMLEIFCGWHWITKSFIMNICITQINLWNKFSSLSMWGNNTVQAYTSKPVLVQLRSISTNNSLITSWYSNI